MEAKVRCRAFVRPDFPYPVTPSSARRTSVLTSGTLYPFFASGVAPSTAASATRSNSSSARRLAAEQRLRPGNPPGNRRDPAQHQPGVADPPFVDDNPRGNPHQRKRPYLAVHRLEVGAACISRLSRHVDRQDDLVRRQGVLDAALVGRRRVERLERHRSLTVRTAYLHLGIQREQRRRQVGGMHRDAGALVEQRVELVLAFPRRKIVPAQKAVARRRCRYHNRWARTTPKVMCEFGSSRISKESRP